MEVKKSQKADLEGKKTLFLEIGLCASLLLMIGAFAWGQDKREAPSLPEVIEEFVPTEEIENTVQDQPVPQMPTPANIMSVITDNIQIVDNNTQIEPSQVFADFEFDTGFSDAASIGEIGGDMPEIFTKVEQDASFQGGGINAFSRWVRTHVTYPEVARSLGIQGKVMVQFIVNTDGTLSDIKVISNTDKMLNDAVLRAVNRAPKEWTPGRQTGKAVRQRIEIPVTFSVN